LVLALAGEWVPAALEWAGRVVADPRETGRRVVVACTGGGEGLRAAAECAGVPTQVLVVHQFSLDSRVGLWVERLGCNGWAGRAAR
jgi:hypothetical protein